MLKIYLNVKKTILYSIIINYAKIILKCTSYNKNKFYHNSLKAIPGSRQREVRLERVEIYLVFNHIFKVIPHDCPRIAKSLLSSFSTGPRYKNIVQGTSYILGINPGGWLEHVL